MSLLSAVNNLFAPQLRADVNGTKRKPQSRKKKPVRLQVETLEDRQVPAVITDMTQLALQFPRHSGPTTVWLNFDGNTSQGVSSFQSVSGDINRDIHDIIFKTQQIFAPFDVIVQRRYGNGSTDTGGGNTTVFIGDKPNSYGTGFGAYTPWASSDFPGTNKGITHQPNSDTSDVAYVDPVYVSGGSNVSVSTSWIAQAIAHEAGHSFGLVHVLTSPDPEIMSYDASNTRFMNKAFNITTQNYDPSTGGIYNEPALQPQWRSSINLGFYTYYFTTNITTQNSYTYLQAVLGSRSTDWANVADPTAVDSAYTDGTMPFLGLNSSTTGGVNRSGDFDVFNFTPSATGWVTINVTRYGTSYVDPVLLAYNSTGQSVVGFDDDGGNGVESRLTMWVTAGQNYKLAVGSYGGGSTGNYQISIGSASWYAYLPTYSYVLASQANPVSSYNFVVSGAGAGSASGGMATDQVFNPAQVGGHNLTPPGQQGNLLGGLARALTSQDDADDPWQQVGHGGRQGRRWDAVVDQLFSHQDDLADVLSV